MKELQQIIKEEVYGGIEDKDLKEIHIFWICFEETGRNRDENVSMLYLTLDETLDHEDIVDFWINKAQSNYITGRDYDLVKKKLLVKDYKVKDYYEFNHRDLANTLKRYFNRDLMHADPDCDRYIENLTDHWFKIGGFCHSYFRCIELNNKLYKHYQENQRVMNGTLDDPEHGMDLSGF